MSINFIKTGIDTSDATATSEDLIQGKVAYAKGQRITGTNEGTDQYFKDKITPGSASLPGVVYLIKTIPDTISVDGTSLAYTFQNCIYLNSIPLIDTSNVTDMQRMFYYCGSLTSIPLLDTKNVLNMYQMFRNCTSLQNIPLLNTQSVTNMQGMFQQCSSLSDDSLNNILSMCINATSYTGTKSLAQLGLTSSYYSTSRIQALSNYQNFINAGWSIGY